MGRVVIAIGRLYITSDNIKSDGILSCVAEPVGNVRQRKVTNIFSVELCEAIVLPQSSFHLSCSLLYLADFTASRPSNFR